MSFLTIITIFPSKSKIDVEIYQKRTLHRPCLLYLLRSSLIIAINIAINTLTWPQPLGNKTGGKPQENIDFFRFAFFKTFFLIFHFVEFKKLKFLKLEQNDILKCLPSERDFLPKFGKKSLSLGSYNKNENTIIWCSTAQKCFEKCDRF